MNQDSLKLIKDFLAPQTESTDLSSFKRSAAVALILGGSESEDILFIHRSQKEGDPWSGHIAFPGGGTEEIDEDSKATAMRETIEEVGIDLSNAQHLGLLKRMQLHKLGSPIDFGLECHIFHLSDHQSLSMTLDPDEVDEAFWVPRTELFGTESISEELFHFSGLSKTLPCLKVRGKIIWGITYMLLSEFQNLVRESTGEDVALLPPHPYSRA